MEFTKKGKIIKVEGKQPIIGEKAPNFSIENKKNEMVTLDAFKGNVLLISVVPDIDTRVCDIQTKAFNKDASNIEGVKLITISTNTKDEQEKWCAGEGIDMEMLHDTNLSFGKLYGIAIPELNVLARSVFIINAVGELVYKEVVSEMVDEPNYDQAIKNAKLAR